MRYDKGHKDATRQRIIEVASRQFREQGVAAVGLAGIMSDAGLTNGAFYAHFDSKAEAFRLAVADGLSFLRGGVLKFQESHGRNWREPFIDFYLGDRMQVALDEACGLPSFSSDVARADDATRAVYEAKLELLVDAIAGGLRGAHARERALALLAILSGAASMARAVKSEAVRRDILAAANVAAKAI